MVGYINNMQVLNKDRKGYEQTQENKKLCINSNKIRRQNMRQIHKLLIPIFIMLVLAISALVIVNAKESLNTTDGILSWQPYDSTSTLQSSNTNDVFMKISGIRDTDWYDIEGYYNQPNYLQLPITVELMNKTNYPIKYKYVQAYVQEYDSNWRYRSTVYSTNKRTSSSGRTDFLVSIPYKGYEILNYRVLIYYDDPNSDKFVYYGKRFHSHWYINPVSSPEEFIRGLINQ